MPERINYRQFLQVFRESIPSLMLIFIIIGGIIAGFGARLAMGCNLAAFFTGIPQFSLHAWFFAIATAIGSWFGARFTLLPIFRIPVKMQKVSAASPLTQKPDQARRRFRLGILVFFGCWAGRCSRR